MRWREPGQTPSQAPSQTPEPNPKPSPKPSPKAAPPRPIAKTAFAKTCMPRAPPANRAKTAGMELKRSSGRRRTSPPMVRLSATITAGVLELADDALGVVARGTVIRQQRSAAIVVGVAISLQVEIIARHGNAAFLPHDAIKAAIASCGIDLEQNLAARGLAVRAGNGVRRRSKRAAGAAALQDDPGNGRHQ